MGRIRQQHPQNYGSSGNIHTDFENLYRYLNAAELGDNTVGELLAQLFDADGNFDGPIEMRLNQSNGLEYRIGEYRSAEDGWKLLAAIDTIRGPAGINLGQIDGPLFFNRVDTVIASNGTTTVPYTFDPSGEDIMVLKNGLLLRGTGSSPDYTYSAGTITLATAVNIGVVITAITIRASAVSNYRRLDYIAVGTVAVVPFAFTDSERLLVYRNGILQREGSGYDYVKSAATDTITFLTPLANDDVATIITVENQSQVAVAGLMLEDEYTENGFIKYEKLVVNDGQITQAKVSGLVAALSSKAKITAASSSPSTPGSTDFWLDTSVTPNVLKFYDGTQWLSASPDNALPNFAVSNAGQYARVNGTGTQLEFGSIDFSSLVPKTYMGAANGVASLDSAGKLPTGQLPTIYSTNCASVLVGSATNGTYRSSIGIYKQKIRIDGLSAILTSGTCTIQLAVDGVAVGSTYAVSSSRINQTFSPIEVDALTVGRLIQVIVTSASSAVNLDVIISYATVTV